MTWTVGQAATAQHSAPLQSAGQREEFAQCPQQGLSAAAAPSGMCQLALGLMDCIHRASVADLARVVPSGHLTALPLQPLPHCSETSTLHSREHTSVALSALSRANTMALQMSVLDTVRARSRSSNLHVIRGCLQVLSASPRAQGSKSIQAQN